MKLLAYVDGSGAYKDQKEAGVGVILVDRDNGELIWYGGEEIGFKTNNEAEYHGVIYAMYAAQDFDCTDLVVRSDSKLIVNQISGEWKVHDNHIRVYYEEVKSQAENFDHFVVEWIPRTQNRAADKLASGYDYPEDFWMIKIREDMSAYVAND